MTTGTASGFVSQDDSRTACGNHSDRVSHAAQFLSAMTPITPGVGIILGSGLGGVVDDVKVVSTVSYEKIPGFPRSTAPGHAGRLVLGSLSGTPVVVLQGRTHLYEGGDVADVTFAVEVLHALGVRRLILTNAAGGLHPQLSVGDLVVIDAHIDFTGARFVEAGANPVHGPWNRRLRLYSPELVERALAVCRREEIVAHQGTYVAVTGPNYETRAEYRMFRLLGGDVVGMSTVPETLAAARLELEVLALSIVTNVCRPDQLAVTDCESVVRAAERAEWKLRTVLRGVLCEHERGEEH